MIILAPLIAQDGLLQRAAQLDSEGKCQEAESLYQQALAKGQPSVPLLNNIGNHALACGDPNGAETYFKRVLKLDSSHPNANLQLARLALDKKNGIEALPYLERVSDSSIPVLLLNAEANYYAGNTAKSSQILERLQAEGKRDVRVTFNVGLTYARLGLYDRAETAFTDALAQKPNDFDILLSLGRAATRAKHFDRAQRALEVAARLQPTNPDCLLELGAVYGAMQDYGRAVYTLAQARRVAPRRPDVLLALAHAAEDAGYYGDAVLAYDEYLRLRVDDDSARRDRARVCGQIPERAEEGRKQLAEYVQRHPRDPMGHFAFAQTIWKAQPQEALDHLGTAVQLDPKLSAAFYSRAWLFRRLGRIEESLADLKQCVAQQPGNVRVLDQLALAYLSLDQPKEAERALRHAATIAPQDSQVLMHLSRALIALDRPDEAQKYLDTLQRVPAYQDRDPKSEPGMIELATMSQSDRARQEIARLRIDAQTHPGDADLQLHLAALLLANRQEAEALGAYRELPTMNASPQTFWQAGMNLSTAGKWDLATEFLARAAESLPGAKLDYTIALAQTRGPADALSAMDQILKEDRGGDYFLIRAQLLHAMGKVQDAEASLRSGMELSTSRPVAARRAAALLVNLNREADAYELLTRAKTASPDDPNLMLDRAAVLALVGQSANAERELNRIELRWPEWSRAYLLHGLLLRRMQRAPEGLRRFQMAAALDPSGAIAQCILIPAERRTAENEKCSCLVTIRDFLLSSCGD